MHHLYFNKISKKFIHYDPDGLVNQDGSHKLYRIIQSNKDILQFLALFKPSAKAFMHQHVLFDEKIEVLEGCCTVKHPFAFKKSYPTGSTIQFHKAKSHQVSNEHETNLILLVTVDPHCDTWEDLKRIYQLVQEGKGKNDGTVSLAQQIVMNHHNPTTFLPIIPVWLQKGIVRLLAPLLLKKGVKAHDESSPASPESV